MGFLLMYWVTPRSIQTDCDGQLDFKFKCLNFWLARSSRPGVLTGFEGVQVALQQHSGHLVIGFAEECHDPRASQPKPVHHQGGFSSSP